MLVPVQNPDGTSVSLDKGLDICVVRSMSECFDVESFNCYNEDVEGFIEGNKLCNGVSSNVSVEGCGDGVVDCCDSVVGEELGERIVAGESSACGCVRCIEPTPERSAKLLESLELPQEKLTKHQDRQLRELLEEYSDVFALSDSELGCTDLAKHIIDTGDNRPIKQQPYRTPSVHREKICQMVVEMKDQGIIKPSMSPWASPVVLVPKKDDFVLIIVA